MNRSPISSPGVLSRRKFLKLFFISGAAVSLSATKLLAATSATVGKNATAPAQAVKKPLVVYFSHSGHTRQIAEDIHKNVGGDIVEIKTVKPYPEDYQVLVDQAKEEQKNNARPEISTTIPNLDDYGIIFLGYPNWWSSMPMPVYTFMEQNRLDGKTIAPFVTHGGGRLGHSIEDMKKIVPHAKILTPLAVSGTHASSAMEDVKKWLEGLGSALIMTTTGNPAIYPDGAY